MQPPAPGVDTVERDAERFVEHLRARWRLPLAGVEEKRFGVTYRSSWDQDMTCESMFERAVAHPLWHTFQLVARDTTLEELAALHTAGHDPEALLMGAQPHHDRQNPACARTEADAVSSRTIAVPFEALLLGYPRD